MTPAVEALPPLSVAARKRTPEPAHRRTGSHVHAHSRFPEECLAGGRLEAREADLVRRAVTKLLLELRAPPSANGGFRGLSRVARAVHHALARMAEKFAELYPTIASIAREAGYSERHTARGLGELKALKLVEWDNRCIRTQKPALRGGELVQQISNLYRLLVPPRLRRVMEGLRQGRAAPAGDAASAWSAKAARADRAARQLEELAPAPTRPPAAADRVVVRAVSADFNARLDERARVAPPPVPRAPSRQ